MVLVSTITIKGTPGSTISVTEIREDGGRIRLVVRGAHVTLENIVVQHGEEIEQADGEVGTQNAGVVQNASAGDNQAAETQQEETKEGEEEVNTSLPSSSFSSSSSSPLSSSSTTLSLKQDYNEPFYRVLALMLDDLYERGGVGIEIISSTFPAWLSVGIANDEKLTKDEFEERYIQQVEKAEKPSPSQKEIKLYYDLYFAKHKKEGAFMSWIGLARNGETDGNESDAAFQYVMGLLLDRFYERAFGSEIVEFLPPNLTHNRFHSFYAAPVREEEKRVGKPVQGTSNKERAAYWQLYKARCFSRHLDDSGRFGDKERYMGMIRMARESPSVSVEGGRDEGAEARVV